jgi:small-conductance mechanosensitive channel
MTEINEVLQSPWVHRAVFVLGGVALGYLMERLVVTRLYKLTRGTRFTWDDLLVESIRWLPTVWLSAAGVYLASTLGDEPAWVVPIVSNVLTVTLIGSVAVGGMRLAKGVVESVSAASQGSVGSPSLVVNLAQGAVAVLGLFIILQNLGIDITPLITALGIGGLAVALALQDTLGNLFAGVQIILSRQVRPRDYVQLSSGEEGWVTDVRARNTTIQTFPDGNLVSVPNSLLASASVKNYNLPRPALWVTVGVGISYDSDLEHVERVALDVARGVLNELEGGVPGEDPVFLFNAFADSSINFEVRMMVRDFRSQGPIRHEFIKRLHRKFGDEGIEIPFPIRTLMMNRPGDNDQVGGS